MLLFRYKPLETAETTEVRRSSVKVVSWVKRDLAYSMIAMMKKELTKFNMLEYKGQRSAIHLFHDLFGEKEVQVQKVNLATIQDLNKHLGKY